MMNYKTITLTLGVVATANAIRITSLAEQETETKDLRELLHLDWTDQ